MDEGRKRVMGIIAGILIARHLKMTEDLHQWESAHEVTWYRIHPIAGGRAVSYFDNPNASQGAVMG